MVLKESEETLRVVLRSNTHVELTPRGLLGFLPFLHLTLGSLSALVGAVRAEQPSVGSGGQAADRHAAVLALAHSKAAPTSAGGRGCAAVKEAQRLPMRLADVRARRCCSPQQRLEEHADAVPTGSTSAASSVEVHAGRFAPAKLPRARWRIAVRNLRL